MVEKISFGVEPNMSEVPPGQYALMKLGDFAEWKVVDTEWGDKYSFPIILVEHPSYPSISKEGLSIHWESKCIAAKRLFRWIYNELADEGKERDRTIGTFDFDIDKEIKGNWKLIRSDTGSYLIEKL